MAELASHELEEMRYPAGRYRAPASISKEDCRQAVFTLAEMPEQLRNARSTTSRSTRPIDRMAGRYVSSCITSPTRT
jgi:hypothetical protein